MRYRGVTAGRLIEPATETKNNKNMWIKTPLEIRDGDRHTGRWRLTVTSDEGGGGPFGDTSHDHATPEEAMECEKCNEFCNKRAGFAPLRGTTNIATAHGSRLIERLSEWLAKTRKRIVELDVSSQDANPISMGECIALNHLESELEDVLSEFSGPKDQQPPVAPDTNCTAEGVAPRPVNPRFARFGEAVWLYILGFGDDFFGNEISEDILPLALNAGLCSRVKYDPVVHGDLIEAEPGDEIWWLNGPQDDNLAGEEQGPAESNLIPSVIESLLEVSGELADQSDAAMKYEVSDRSILVRDRLKMRSCVLADLASVLERVNSKAASMGAPEKAKSHE